MTHEAALLGTLTVTLGFALLFGLIASRLRIPLLVGYLLAGIAVGPFTPGVVANTGLAAELAEVGVILLMFGVGLHFSVGDLADVRGVVVPGAILEVVILGAIGAAIARSWGWSAGGCVMFGLSFSVASTIVLLRALEARGQLREPEGRVAVGWLIVEDILMVLALVAVPAVLGLSSGHGASVGALAGTLALTLGKVVAFVLIMLLVGARLLPWLLTRVEQTGSRELFTVAVLAVALVVAFGAAEFFGVSIALSAFVAGVVANGSDVGRRAAADALPLRDAFGVLFFVSVGMLFNPSILLLEPVRVLIAVALVMIVKPLVAFALLRVFRRPFRTALQVSAGLAQIGEFSFILIGLAVTRGLLRGEARDLVLAGAIFSIMLNPLVFRAADWIARRAGARGISAAAAR